MGDPKLPRRAWKKPKRPLNYDLKMDELKTLGQFGLKTKRELWKAHTELSRVRNQARSLLALGQEARKGKEPVLMNSLSRIGLVSKESTLDDVLNLRVTDLLSRRLQTIVMKKLEFLTPYQARQAVTHGHIMIGDKIVDVPSYVVKVEEEGHVKFAPASTLKALIDRSKKEKDARESAAQAAAKEQEELEAAAEPAAKSEEPKGDQAGSAKEAEAAAKSEEPKGDQAGSAKEAEAAAKSEEPKGDQAGSAKEAEAAAKSEEPKGDQAGSAAGQEAPKAAEP